MARLPLWLFPIVAVAPLCACTLEHFEVEPCKAGRATGFRINPIDGWFRNYQPRPDRVLVQTDDDRHYKDRRVWETELIYSGPGDKTFETRPSRTLITYGEKFGGWKIEQPPKPLSEGVSYRVWIDDSGHSGTAVFEAGEPLPAC